MDKFKLLLMLTVVAVITIVSCSSEPDKSDGYLQLPQLERIVTLTDNGDTLAPFRIQKVQDTLFVSYNQSMRIDRYTLGLERINTMFLTDPDTVLPSSFFVSDSDLYITDHSQRVIAIYDREGKYKTSFGKMPDNESQLMPFAITHYGGVLYVSDFSLKNILAISMTDAQAITQRGELILTIPSDSTRSLGLPTALYITHDGRMLIGDSRKGKIEVYACDGRFIYDFDPVKEEKIIAPVGFDMDDIPDPKMQDESSWDPSGLRKQGRYHVVDGNNAKVIMFNPIGEYIASYPDDNSLKKPTNIAIDRLNNRIYICDPLLRQIFIYKYESNIDG